MLIFKIKNPEQKLYRKKQNQKLEGKQAQIDVFNFWGIVFQKNAQNVI